MLRHTLLVLPLLALACPAAPSELARESAPSQTSAAPPIDSETPSPTTLPSEPAAGGLARDDALPIDQDEDEAADAEALAAGESGPTEPALLSEPAEPLDPLAPERPSGPEPGSPESDAELLALLDESTITQDEFAKAFGPGKGMKVDDEGQFEFGAGARERSKVSVGAATIDAGKLQTTEVEALAQADLHNLEVCHAMALSKNPDELGRVTLVLEFGASGKVEQVGVETKLGDALTKCLRSVALTWTLAGAGKAKVHLPLTLSTSS